MSSVALDKNRHDRKSFDCGVNALNNYLRLIANQQSSRDNSRTYILEDGEGNRKIMGFYTLTMISVDLSSLPPNLQKKHKYSDSVVLIARLAVDKQHVKKGLGSWLLVDALKKLLTASDTVGFPLVVVDAKDGVAAFYEKFGFKAFKDEKNKLFITIADIRASLR